MNNPECMQLKVIDSHTGGEPTRTVVGWPDNLEGLDTGSLAQRKQYMAEQCDWIRSACINEPRGHDAMVGALLCKPVNPDCVAGVLFFNNVGYLSSCIHGTIGLTVTLAHMGRITTGKHKIETPIGEVVAELHQDGKVTVTNVPSYRYQANVTVDVPGHGTVVGDIGWGGNWFFLVDGSQVKCPEVRSENIAKLTEFSAALSHTLAEQGITGEGGVPVDHVEIFGEPTPGVSDSRSFVLCPGLAYDRSPCGTGLSAKLACLFADGQLQPGQIWRQASILNTVFEGRIEQLENGRIRPIISGSAYVNGEATLIIQDQDPFRHGIRLDG